MPPELELETAFGGSSALVTGGLGFIGSTLARRLLELGASVTLLDALVPEHGGNRFNAEGIADAVEIVVADVRDESAVAEHVSGRDYVFNLVGQTSHLDSMRDPYTDLEINCRGQLAVLEACRKQSPGARVVYAGSRQVYGRPRYLPVDEAHPVAPVDVNGIHKLAAELYHLLYADVYDLSVCSLRLTNTIGPRMRVKDARQTFLGIWIRRVVEGDVFEVWGGSQLRDFTYVDDAVEAFVRAAADRSMTGVLNVGGGDPVTLRELAELLAEVRPGAQFAMREFPEERLLIDIGDYHADDRRLRHALGWAPRVGLREALERTVAYYERHLDRYV